MATKIQLGFLILVILTSSSYIYMQEEVKLKVGEYKTSICVWGGDYHYDIICGKGWIRGGDEYSKLFRGTTRVYADSREVIETFDGNKTNFTRIAITDNGPTLINEYLFDGDKHDKEKVPMEHIITVINGSGLFYQYEANNLKYSGESRPAVSPESFGNDIKIEWEGDPHISKIYKYKYKDEAKLTLKWRVASDYEVYKIRMFDPSPWWNNSWYSRNQINITENSNTTLVDIAIELNITSHFSINSDYSDLRFLSNCSEGAVELSYWNETQTVDYAMFWVKLPTLNALETKTICMYYNNPDAISTTNGEDTFDFFDDFPDATIDWSKWDNSSTVDTQEIDGNGNLHLYEYQGAWASFPNNRTVNPDYNWTNNSIYKVRLMVDAYNDYLQFGSYSRSSFVPRDSTGSPADRTSTHDGVAAELIASSVNPTSWDTYTIKRANNAGYVAFYKGNGATLVNNHTTRITAGNLSIDFSLGNTRDFYVNWVFFTDNYASPEPTVRIFESVSNCPGEINSTNSPYTLTSNLESNTTCFTIGDDDVIIDGAGFTVNYSMISTGYGVNNTDGYDNITIKNVKFVEPRSGDVALYSFVIYSLGMENSSIDNIIVNNPGRETGIRLDTGSHNVNVTNSELIWTGSSGIGIRILYSNNTRITNTNITHSGTGAIHIIGSPDIYIANSQIWGKHLHWQTILLTSNNLIMINNNITASGLGAFGPSVSQGCTSFSNLNLSWNNITVLSTGDYYGVSGKCALSGTIEGNTIRTETADTHGITLVSGLTIKGNDIATTGATSHGIDCTSSNTIEDNTITTSNTNANGIQCTSSNTIEDNTITVSGGTTSANDPSAIKISGSSNLVLNNDAYATGTYGTGCEISGGTSNNFTGGTCSASVGRDYFLVSSGLTNNFTNTNFSDTRRVYFSSGSEWFNYNNDSSKNVFLRTNMSGASANTYFDRELLSWGSDIFTWNDTNQSGTFELGYELIGLNDYVNYRVKNSTYGSTNANYYETDSIGTLDYFSIALIDETNINVTNWTTIYFNSSLVYDYFEIPTMINITAFSGTSGNTMCLSIDHPDYGDNYICGGQSVESNITIIPAIDTFNDTDKSKIYNTTDLTHYFNIGLNSTEVKGLMFNLTKVGGSCSPGTSTCDNISLYINDSAFNMFYSFQNTFLTGDIGSIIAFKNNSFMESYNINEYGANPEVSIYIPRNTTIITAKTYGKIENSYKEINNFEDKTTAGTTYIYGIGDGVDNTPSYVMHYFKLLENQIANNFVFETSGYGGTPPATIDIKLCLMDNTITSSCTVILDTIYDITASYTPGEGIANVFNANFTEREFIEGNWYGIMLYYDSNNDGTPDVVDSDGTADTLIITAKPSNDPYYLMSETRSGSTSYSITQTLGTHFSDFVGLRNIYTPKTYLKINDNKIHFGELLVENRTTSYSIADSYGNNYFGDEVQILQKFSVPTDGYIKSLKLYMRNDYFGTLNDVTVTITIDSKHNSTTNPIPSTFEKYETTINASLIRYVSDLIDIPILIPIRLIVGEIYEIIVSAPTSSYNRYVWYKAVNETSPYDDCPECYELAATSIDSGTSWTTQQYNMWFNMTYYNYTSENTSYDIPVAEIQSNIDSCSETICLLNTSLSVENSAIVNLSSIEINYTFNPITVPISYINSYMTDKTWDLNIPLSILGGQGEYNITAINLSFYGDKNYTVIANYTGDAVENSSTTRQLNLVWSNFSLSYINNYDRLLFIAPHSNSKNVTPYGQTSTLSSMNFTYDASMQPMNISLWLNESVDSCINLTASSTNSKTDGYLFSNETRFNITDFSSGVRQVWFWEDLFSCNGSQTKFYTPYLNVESKCSLCM